MKLALLLGLGMLLGAGVLTSSSMLSHPGVQRSSNPIPLCPDDNPNCGLN